MGLSVVAQREAAGRVRARVRAGDASRGRGGSVRRVWLVSFLAFFLLGAGWALAMPYDGPPDELQHVMRAYGVMEGQVFAGGVNREVRTARSIELGAAAGCFRWDVSMTAACQGEPSTRPADTGTVIWGYSAASGYDPSYYFLVGPVIHAMPTMRGILAARLLTDAEISAFLATALAVAWSTARGRWMLGGVLVGVTPVVVGLMGAVNPAGVEIGAALAFWVGVLDLFGPGRPRRWVVAVTGWSGAVLAVTRGFGVGWLLIILAVCALSSNRARLRELWAFRPVRWSSAVVGVACGVGVAWGVAAGPNYPLTAPTMSATPLSHMLAHELWIRIPYYVDGMIGLTSYGNVPMPRIVPDLSLVFLGLLILGGLVAGSARTRVQMLAVLAIACGILITADLNAVRQGYWFSQGRYALPILVGVPILGSAALGRAGILSVERNISLLRWMAVVLLPLQSVALYVTMLRFESGFASGFDVNAHYRPLNPLHGRWHPEFGPLPPILIFCLGLAVFAIAAWRAPSWLRTPESRNGDETRNRLRTAAIAGAPSSASPA